MHLVVFLKQAHNIKTNKEAILSTTNDKKCIRVVIDVYNTQVHPDNDKSTNKPASQSTAD